MRKIFVASPALVAVLFLGIVAYADPCPKGNHECENIKSSFISEWPDEYFYFCGSSDSCIQIEDWDMKDEKEIQSKIKKVLEIAPGMMFLDEKNPLGYRIIAFDIVYDKIPNGKYALSEVAIWYEKKSGDKVVIIFVPGKNFKKPESSTCIPTAYLPSGFCLLKPDARVLNKETKYFQSTAVWSPISNKYYIEIVDASERPKTNDAPYTAIAPYLLITKPRSD